MKEVMEEKERINLEKASDFILKIGIKQNSAEYMYIKDAIMIYIYSKSRIVITKDVYPVIAKKYKTRKTIVERVIRKAIEKVFSKEKISLLEDTFKATINAETGKLSNAEFISIIADKIKFDNAGELYEKTTDLMIEIGILPKYEGYKYIREAVVLILQDRSFLNEPISRKLYPKLSQEFNKNNWKIIERLIRHTIEITWERGNPEMLKRVFRFSSGKKRPSNLNFLIMMVDEIKK